ncbi:Gamma-aminobutyrate:alpha-ketoglutarate aminotransferase (EC [Olavius sp. associated proteobacterium Delta 1]|nr:Gamma-aminobutyrate:alpha-ketoglutarate aminotransferase (EC [Olavius sp. associated proteobacterium Delta 1]
MTKLTERQIALLKHTFIDFQQTSEFIKNPLIIDRADGLYYWDTAGRQYFDTIGGIFVAVLGHRHPRLLRAMHDQMEKITFAPPLHATTNVTLDFIEKLAGVTPGNLNYIKPLSGGSEAVECALKFVRQYYKQTGYPQKYKFVSRYYGYHGGTFGAMAASGTGVRKTRFEPQMAGFLKVFPPNYYRDRFDTWEACNRFSARAFEDVILHEDPATVAGVIVEPVGNTGGIITPTDEYFKILRETCSRHNIALIFDEVITGIAKTGAMFAAQKFGVTPDIICCGKGISSGMLPLGAMIAREDMADAFYGLPEDEVQFAHGHTYAGNPLASAVGTAVLDEITENRLADKAQSLGEYLNRKLQKLKSLGVIREIRGKGILRGVELVKDTRTMLPFPELGNALKASALKNGLIMRIDPTWFAVAPPLIAEKSDIDDMCERIEKSLADALAMV